MGRAGDRSPQLDRLLSPLVEWGNRLFSTLAGFMGWTPSPSEATAVFSNQAGLQAGLPGCPGSRFRLPGKAGPEATLDSCTGLLASLPEHGWKTGSMAACFPWPGFLLQWDFELCTAVGQHCESASLPGCGQ